MAGDDESTRDGQGRRSAQPPSLTQLWRTESGARYAQDGAGRIYRNGEPEADGVLIAVAVPRSSEGTVVVGRRVYLLMDNGPLEDRWRLTTRVVELYAQPVLPQLPDGWQVDLRDVHEMLEELQ